MCDLKASGVGKCTTSIPKLLQSLGGFPFKDLRFICHLLVSFQLSTT